MLLRIGRAGINDAFYTCCDRRVDGNFVMTNAGGIRPHARNNQRGINSGKRRCHTAAIFVIANYNIKLLPSVKTQFVGAACYQSGALGNILRDKFFSQ